MQQVSRINIEASVEILPKLSFLAASAISPGDSLSGTISFTSCLDFPDHPISLLLAKGQGNVFGGALISKPGEQLRNWNVGAFYTAGGKLLVVPEGYVPAASLTLACEFTEEGHADCQALTDSFSRSCGTASLSKDERSRIFFYFEPDT